MFAAQWCGCFNWWKCNCFLL